MEKTEIRFYSHKNKYFEFSNFSRHPITIDGVLYRTTEHYFQAMKFKNTHHAMYNSVVASTTPAIAKTLGGNRNVPIEPDWDKKRDDIMRTAIEAKFSQHDELRKLLLSTGDAILVEDSPNDYYWGCGKTGTGKNRLGQLLMEYRDHTLEKGF